MYGRKAWDVVGYVYRAEIVCPGCILAAMGEYAYRHDNAEDALARIAMRRGIDRMAEYTFDSDAFPKVIFSSDSENGEPCNICGEDL